MDQGLTYYTYPRLEKLNHYGDWQAEFESGALVYYERYEDETYGFYGANLSTLKTSKFVVGDGYALAYIEKKDATDNVTVTYANDKRHGYRLVAQLKRLTTRQIRSIISIRSQRGRQHQVYRHRRAGYILPEDHDRRHRKQHEYGVLLQSAFRKNGDGQRK